ncbi:MAG TPA: hypothetical protein VFB20_07065 [Burkholderiales bacterium]|nr:hypothetical protein [Burkholderiales bacterium]
MNRKLMFALAVLGFLLVNAPHAFADVKAVVTNEIPASTAGTASASHSNYLDVFFLD